MASLRPCRLGSDREPPHQLGGEHEVTKLKVWGGFWYSYSYWDRTNRPKEIEVRWSDGTQESFDLADEKKVSELVLDAPKTTSTVRIRIKQVYSGSTWLDTAISEIQVFDSSQDETATVASMSSSSKLAADADGDYEPINVTDGLSDSMWCEGSADGDGSGEWIEFTFDGEQRVAKLKMINGIGTSLPFWMKGNRVTSGTLTFSDGATESITIRSIMLPQTIEFTARKTRSVRLTMGDVTRGTEFNDLCISEASFEE